MGRPDSSLEHGDLRIVGVVCGVGARLAEAEKRFKEALETFDSGQACYDVGRTLRS